MLAEATIQFGTILIDDVFKEQGKETKDIKNHLTLLFTISTIVQFPSALLSGALADKFMNYKLLFVYNIINITGLIIILLDY